MDVRFLNNFIITVKKTILDENENLTVVDMQRHVKMGDIHSIDNYVEKDNFLTLYFSDKSSLHGVAFNIEKDYCEILKKRKPFLSSGCNGCGKK